MTGRDWHPLIAHCLGKPFAYEDHPFGPDSLIVKVKGHITTQFFALRGERMVTFKCKAEFGDFFKHRYPDTVTRGYHCPPVQQPYWITVRMDGTVPDEQLWSMADHAYQAVVDKLPSRIRREMEEEVRA